MRASPGEIIISSWMFGAGGLTVLGIYGVCTWLGMWSPWMVASMVFTNVCIVAVPTMAVLAWEWWNDRKTASTRTK